MTYLEARNRAITMSRRICKNCYIVKAGMVKWWNPFTWVNRYEAVSVWYVDENPKKKIHGVIKYNSNG